MLAAHVKQHTEPDSSKPIDVDVPMKLDCPTDQRIPCVIPPEIQALLDAYVDGIPVAAVASREELLKCWELHLPKEYAYVYLGFFSILCVNVSLITASISFSAHLFVAMPCRKVAWSHPAQEELQDQIVSLVELNGVSDSLGRQVGRYSSILKALRFSPGRGGYANHRLWEGNDRRCVPVIILPLKTRIQSQLLDTGVCGKIVRTICSGG